VMEPPGCGTQRWVTTPPQGPDCACATEALRRRTQATRDIGVLLFAG
jgi:hypothetical protein